jgi:hypothetical protein
MAERFEAGSEIDHDRPGRRRSVSLPNSRLRSAARLAVARTVTLCAFCILLLSGGCARRALAQADSADIDEATAGAIYVNPQSAGGSDSNPGTSAQPLRTIARAVAMALARRERNLGTKIELYPSIYRESVEIGPSRKGATAPIILEATSSAPVVVSGANVWTGWRATKPGIWTHPWPYRWGVAPNPPGWESQRLNSIVKRREMIVVNGQSLTQAEAPASMQEHAGSFYVDESGGAIYLHAPDGIDAGSATIEVAERASLLRIRGQSRLVLRGIKFQHSNGALQLAAVTIENSSNVLIDRCGFNWNNWMGLSVRGVSNLAIKKSSADFNGGVGMTIWRTNDLSIADTETSHNNWRGYAGGFTGWAAAGIKSLQVTNARYDGLISTENKARGAWFDTGCTNVVVDHASLCRNFGDGVFLEANQGPLAITGSIICNNQVGAGVLSGNSSHVTLEGNIIYGNAKSQILISGFYNSPRPVKDWQSGQTLMLESDHWKITHNVIAGGSARQLLLATTLAPQIWKNFVDNLNSRDNVWYNPANSNALQMAGGTALSLSQWQRQFGLDRDSTFENPRFRDPANGDFTLAAGSPIAGRRLPAAPGKSSE